MSAGRALPDVPGLPRDADGPVFGAPWQAQAFAMTLALYEHGLFTWPEWAQLLAHCIAAAPAQPGEDAGDAYYRQWLAALEAMVAGKGASSAAELQRYQDAWDHAADRTPHGQPIELQVGDFEHGGVAGANPPREDPSQRQESTLPPEGRPSGIAGSMRRL